MSHVPSEAEMLVAGVPFVRAKRGYLVPRRQAAQHRWRYRRTGITNPNLLDPCTWQPGEWVFIVPVDRRTVA